jgi:hypothetical protein
MKYRITTRILALSLALWSLTIPSVFGSRNDGPPATAGGLEDGTLSLRFSEPGLSVLTNKLTGRSYTLSAEPFALLIEIDGIRSRATAEDFLLGKAENPSPASLRLQYGGKEGRKGLAVQVDYELGEKAWYVRKHLTVLNGMREAVVIHDATVDDLRIKEVPFPAKAENPIFLDGQLFWGME